MYTWFFFLKIRNKTHWSLNLFRHATFRIILRTINSDWENKALKIIIYLCTIEFSEIQFELKSLILIYFLFIKDILIKANNHLFVSRPYSSTRCTPSLSSSNHHRAASSMAISSATSTFNVHLYTNVVNLEFENDSADLSLLLSNLKASCSHPNQLGLLPKLKKLKFFKTTMSSKSLIEVFDEAPKLQSLQLTQCDSLFMTGFLSVNLAQVFYWYYFDIKRCFSCYFSRSQKKRLDKIFNNENWQPIL